MQALECDNINTLFGFKQYRYASPQQAVPLVHIGWDFGIFQVLKDLWDDACIFWTRFIYSGIWMGYGTSLLSCLVLNVESLPLPYRLQGTIVEA